MMSEGAHAHMSMHTNTDTHTVDSYIIHTQHTLMSNMSHLYEDVNTDQYKKKHKHQHILSTLSANMINRHTIMEMLVYMYKVDRRTCRYMLYRDSGKMQCDTSNLFLY